MKFREHLLPDESVPRPVPGVGVPYRNGNTGTPLEPHCAGTAREQVGNRRNSPRQTLAFDLISRWRNKSPAPPARAARKIPRPICGAAHGSASPLVVSAAHAEAWPSAPAARALQRSRHRGQRTRTRGRPGPRSPGGCWSRRGLPRFPGLEPGTPLQSFENSGVTGGVRRRVRSFALGVRAVLRLLAARVIPQREVRERVFLRPVEAP